MSTVPTLTIGGTDQTGYIQNKSFVVRLKTLDVVLVDPVDDPVLHDVVSVDTPDWHGRVSTIESNPYRMADGTDHRWVKITCTNKHVAASASAPFGLSDAPNLSTTFPYRKDFTYTQTLADQTDLASAEHRLKATIDKSGIVPGMTVAVTNAAEGLSAVDFIVTEVTVSWLRDDFAEYLLEASVEGVPPVTLGDIINNATCDCAPYDCPPTDFYLTDVPTPQISCVIDASSPSGDRNCRSDVDRSPTEVVTMYAAATYKVRYSVHHGPLQWELTCALVNDGGMSECFPFDAGGSNYDHGFGHPPIPLSGWIFGSPPFDADYGVHLNDQARSGNNGVDSSVFAEIVYVSGNDPRFVDLPMCPDPHSGQLVQDGSTIGDGSTTDFTTSFPYGASTLEVFVNGLDWTAQITETDPTTGDWALAYAPSLGATVRPVYRGA